MVPSHTRGNALTDGGALTDRGSSRHVAGPIVWWSLDGPFGRMVRPKGGNVVTNGRLASGLTAVVGALALIATTAGLASASPLSPSASPAATGRLFVGSTRPVGNTLVQKATTDGTGLPDVPPSGAPLDTMTNDAQIRFRGTAAPNTAACSAGSPCINYAVIDRQTLGLVASGQYPADVGGLEVLRQSRVEKYIGSLNYLVVLNWQDFSVAHTTIEADRRALDATLKKIGAAPMTAAQQTHIRASGGSPGSAVGAAGGARRIGVRDVRLPVL